MQDEKPQTTPPETTTSRQRRRGAMFWIGWSLGGAIALVALTVLALWVRLGAGPLILPEPVRAEIEARLDAQMVLGRVAVGEMALDMPDGGRAPVLEMREVSVVDPGGAPRAAFPALRIYVDPGSILSGIVRPKRVEIAGAGLRLSRDEQGRFDLDLSGAGTSPSVGVPETMARLDAMFASSGFDGLDEIVATGLQISMADAMTDQVMRIDEGTARLTRRAGQLTLTMGGALAGSREARLDLALLRRAGEAETELAAVIGNLAARDVATMSPALAWLDLMRAPISGRLAVQLRDDGTVGDLQGRLEIGQGTLSLGAGDAPIGFDRIAADMEYDPTSQRLRFDSLALQTPALRFNATGHADVGPAGNVFAAQFALSDIAGDPGGVFGREVAAEGARIDLRLTLRPHLRLEFPAITIFEADRRLRLSGMAEVLEDGVHVRIDAHVPRADVATVLSYWPETAIPGTRRWVAERMAEATFEAIDIAYRAQPSAPPDTAVSLAFRDMTLRALRTGPPITGGAGALSVTDGQLVLRLESGEISARPGDPGVDLGGSTMVIADALRPRPEAVFSLRGRGPLQSLLTVLAGQPFDIFGDGDMVPERIGTGDAVIDSQFALRLMPREQPATLSELGLTANAVVTGVVATNLVPGQPIRADTVAVTVDPRSVRVAGQAEIAGVPISGRWSRGLGAGDTGRSLVEARAELSAATLAAFGLDVPPGTLDGTAPLGLRLELPDGTPGTLRLESELSGLALSIPQLAWGLSAAQTGLFQAEIALGPSPQVTGLQLDAPGLSAIGAASPGTDGQGDRLDLERLVVGDWLDVSGSIGGQGAGQPPRVEITGGRLAVTRIPPIQGDPGARPLPLQVRLDQVEVGPGLALRDLDGQFEVAGGITGDFTADVNGAAELSGILERNDFGPDLRLLSADGGAVLRAAGILSNAYGGRMSLRLRARSEPRTYRGILSIESPRLRDAPAMAELLNAISVVGLIEQLGQEGINLGEVDARFLLEPGRLTLDEGTAVGPALGISMDGVYDLSSRQYDMQGVVSPLYLVNGLVGALFAPRREGLFGFNYNLAGTAEDSSVTVNPLSILTPGIFREIFRRPPPDLTEAPPQTETQ